MLAGSLFHTAWATDLADEDTPRETRSEIETSVPLTYIQTDEEIGKQGGVDEFQGMEKKLLLPCFSPRNFPHMIG